MSNAQENMDLVTGGQVVLAGVPYIVRAVPVARVKTIAPVLAGVFKDFDMKNAKDDPEKVANSVVDKVLEEAPHAVLSIFIKDLPVSIFQDPEQGVTFPELIYAFHKVLQVNRLDALKNVFSRLLPTFLEAWKEQASLSQKTS